MNDRWLEREARYWEAAYDQLKTEFLALKESHDRWKEGHEKLFLQFEQFKEWYTLLEKDRDRFREWDEGKRSELERLTKETARLVDQVNLWQGEHAKVVATLQQRDDEATKASTSWQEEHAKVVATLRQRDDEATKAETYWREEHAKLVAQVQQWVSWFRDLQKDRDQYIRWDADKKMEIERLNSTLRNNQQDLDRKDQEIQQLQQWMNKLLSNPLRYAAQFVKRLFRRGT
jgi:chromosome segregation ATPase